MAQTARRNEDNPFRLPPDDQIFLVRKEERENRATERERVKQLKVHEKTTASSRVHKNRRTYNDTDEQRLRDETDRTARLSQSVGREPPRPEKENVADFVAKKREMFLLQMGLDVKRAEMQKLKEKGEQKEEALRKSEQMLDEDVTRFDAFLQNNDQKAHKAMKVAEDMTKEKQEKVAKIKSLKQSLSAVESHINVHNEGLKECLKYKTFLKRLTPREWKDAQKVRTADRRLQRRSSWVEERFADSSRQMQAEIDNEERLAEERAQEAAKGGRRRNKREVEEEAKDRERQLEMARRRIRRQYPTRESIEEQYEEVDSGEEEPLYFQQPSQLLDVFTSLEESNLFLIQNSQDTEQVLEQLQQQEKSMKREWDAKTNRLKQNIEEDERVIQGELLQCENLRQIISQKRAGTKQDELLNQLKKEVYDVHVTCGHDSANDLDTHEMLKAIEASLEVFLTYLDQAEADGHAAQVEEMERKKKRERRNLIRNINKDKKDRRDEERLQASLKRSQAPVHKKTGKQIMFRSAPLFQQRKAVEEDDGFEESKRDHEVFGIFLAKTGEPNASAPTKAA